MEFPDDRKYAESHEWALVDGDRVTMGISAYAQDALGDVVFVELPSVGQAVKAGEPMAEVESTKSVSDVYAPASGTVVEVNPALEDSPELVNASPYAEGWFAVIEASDISELEGLLDAAAYEATLA